MRVMGVAAVILGLVILVFLLGISAGWLSREHRTRAMGVAVVIVGLTIVAIVASIYRFGEMGVAAVPVGLIVLVFLFGISAGWLSRERRMGVMSVAAVIAGLIILVILESLDRYFQIGVTAVVGGLIILVLLLGISAALLSRAIRMRVMGVAAVFVGLIVLDFQATMYWFDEIEPRLCSESERIVTTDQAEAFGKQYIRNHESFWEGIEVSGKEEIEELVQRHCCVVKKGDYLEDDPSRWRVSMVGTKGRYVFDYEALFSECGKAVRVLKQVSEY